MNFYANIFFRLLYLTYPLLIYLFYVAYNKNYQKEENNLFLDVALISSFYLMLRFRQPMFPEIPPIVSNVPLIMAYLKKRYITVFLLSIILIINYIFYFDLNPILIIIEYIVYYLLYLKLRCEKNYEVKFVNAFIILKAFFFSLLNILNNNIIDNNYYAFFLKIFSLIIMLYIITYFTFILFNKGEEIIKYHMDLKELEKEKQIRTSLFKITHEIKNPIAVCKGYLDMFDPNNKEHSIKYIPILREEIEQVLVLLQDFLSITKATLEKETLDIFLLIEDVVDSLKFIQDKKNIKLIMNLPEDEVYIDGDYNRLKQVFMNIIKNSIEAIPDNRNGVISIDCEIKKDKLMIFIKDNGIGMNCETLNKINEPFFTTKSNGTGLGTTLSFDIIKAHGGKIKYTSKENIGTTVEIVFDIMYENI